MYSLKVLEGAATKFDAMYDKSVVWEEAYKKIARYKAIVLRSIENIDTLFSLHDLDDELNIKSAVWFAKIIEEHFTFKFNTVTPNDKAFDIELNYILGYVHKIAKQLIADDAFNLWDEIKKAYKEYWEILAEQRKISKAKQEVYNTEAKAIRDEMVAKQKALDEKNSIENIDDITDQEEDTKENIDNIKTEWKQANSDNEKVS